MASNKQINNPINVVAWEVSAIVGMERGDIIISGTNASITMSVSKVLATTAHAALTALAPIIVEDPIDCQGSITTASPVDRFTATYIGFDNNDDGCTTSMYAKKGTQDFLKVSMRSKIRDDVLAALAVIMAI